MPKFPEPPAGLAGLEPVEYLLPAGAVLSRVYFRGGPHPSDWRTMRAYGPVDARFDHHEPPPRTQDRRVLYAALDATTCLAEVFQRRRSIDVRRREPWLVGFETRAALRLLDLTGVWPTRAGASMAINTGQRARARRWARAIYAAYPQLHGIYYPSSMHANRPALVLFERAEPALPAAPLTNRALADPLLEPYVRRAAAELNYRLVGLRPG
ncbi:MAG TPA: RES family NAD+ phosphorylase [Chloroflexota bacterium]|nr:RES family NAD+ phosphorylase [Chloroflexota bacterium]